MVPFHLERYFAQYEFNTRYLLSSSDCDGLELKEALASMPDSLRQRWDSQTLGYTESQGLPELREQISTLYEGIDPQQILVCTPEEGIYMSMRAVLKPGDEVICTFPAYQSLYQVAESIGCQIKHWKPRADEAWRFAPEDLEALISDRTRLLVFNFPNHPTGYLPSREDFAQIVALAEKHQTQIFSDEMYRFLELDEADRLPSASEVSKTAISLFGMSKTYALAGLGLGWLVCQDPSTMEALKTYKDYTTICSPGPSELLAWAGLLMGPELIKRHTQRVKKHLDLFDKFLTENSGWAEFSRPKAGTIGFVHLLKEKSAETFCKRLVQEHGVMLLPSTIYNYGDSHFRMGFGRKNYPEALEKLSEAI